MSQETFLYRGVSVEMHREGIGVTPKQSGLFLRGAKFDEAVFDSGETYGESEANAAIAHQRGHDTCGISTTPIFSRACHYATRGGTVTKGIVYKIDRRKLAEHRVDEYIVSGIATWPEVPEDEEVILVSAQGPALPAEVIVEIIEFEALTVSEAQPAGQ